MADYSAFKSRRSMITSEHLQRYMELSVMQRFFTSVTSGLVCQPFHVFSCNSTGTKSIGEKGKLPHLELFRIKWLTKAYLNDVAD